MSRNSTFYINSLIAAFYVCSIVLCTATNTYIPGTPEYSRRQQAVRTYQVPGTCFINTRSKHMVFFSRIPGIGETKLLIESVLVLFSISI